ncbi:transcriptional regulator with XRE-family HTH domain [Kitasatospora sp. MAA4]|uniref:helix-turn-helix domain-containing protein n=1 Tax=Kitasatospora sp. MAA4 TaxID=3035093 RepID=UPI0024769AE8|nr:helix-turn-helix transcriptional regulator [Kitasatospora sp. MAA4]MDH6134036.1 transcriptional regulator with XRE-family HTH domain [Kitasatospora sp. MAA4]
MAANEVPTVRHRRVALELRRMREEAGLSAEDVASRIPAMNLPKLSRYENARVANPKPDVVEGLLDLYGCEPELKTVLLEITREKNRRGWWQGYRDALNPLYTDLIGLEATALSIKAYEASYIPGLFQTRAYAETIIAKSPTNSASRVPAMVDVRIARQAVLTRAEDPLKMWAVIHESALSPNVGERVMAEQLDKLAGLSRHPNIQIQIMEASAPPHPGMSGAFTLLEFPQRNLDIVLTSGMITSDWVEEVEHVDIYRAGFNEIMAAALNLDDSLGLIVEKRDTIK